MIRRMGVCLAAICVLTLSACGELDSCADVNGMWHAETSTCYCREGRVSAQCVDAPYPADAEEPAEGDGEPDGDDG